MNFYSKSQNEMCYKMPSWWYEKESDWIFDESQEILGSLEREAEDFYSYLPDD